MSNLFWLTDAQMDRLRPFFPKSHGKRRVDDRRVLSGIIFINRNGLRWCDAPAEYGPAKTLYNRWKRWGDKGIFARMMHGLASEAAVPKTVMIDATYLKPQTPCGGHRCDGSCGASCGGCNWRQYPAKAAANGVTSNNPAIGRTGSSCTDGHVQCPDVSGRALPPLSQ